MGPARRNLPFPTAQKSMPLRGIGNSLFQFNHEVALASATPPSELPPIVDLRAVAADLAGHPGLERLVSMIDRIARMQSCIGDLKEAHDCCVAISETVAGHVLGAPEVLEMLRTSALVRAITLYERAVNAASKRGERGSFAIREQLSEAAMADHDALVAVRNRALAHVHVGDDIDGETWHQSLVFAVRFPQGWAPASASERVHFHREAFERCCRILPVARALLEARCHAEMEKLSYALSEARLSDAAFLPHTVDPALAFGSLEVARETLAAWGLEGAAFLHSRAAPPAKPEPG